MFIKYVVSDKRNNHVFRCVKRMDDINFFYVSKVNKELAWEFDNLSSEDKRIVERDGKLCISTGDIKKIEDNTDFLEIFITRDIYMYINKNTVRSFTSHERKDVKDFHLRYIYFNDNIYKGIEFKHDLPHIDEFYRMMDDDRPIYI